MEQECKIQSNKNIVSKAICIITIWWSQIARQSSTSVQPVEKIRSGFLFGTKIKTEKGIWWMPRYYEPMKDVTACDKPRGDGK